MKIIAIIPAYNEEESILNVIQNIEKEEIDYIVINDCSTDNTKDILYNINANYVDLKINLGIGGGVQTGYMYAYENNYDIAIQIDGDGQHNPKYIKEIIKPIINGEANMVIGSRFINRQGFQSSFLRRIGINWLSIVIKILTGQKIYDVTSGYRAVDKKLIEIFRKDYAQDYPEPEAIVTAITKGYKVKEVSTLMEERQSGESSIKAFRTIYYMLKVTIALFLARFKEKN